MTIYGKFYICAFQRLQKHAAMLILDIFIAMEGMREYSRVNGHMNVYFHDDVIKWKHFPRYWHFVRGIHRSWPVTRSFDVFFDLHLNKRLSKQPWGCWFGTPSWSLWRHCNVSSANEDIYKNRFWNEDGQGGNNQPDFVKDSPNLENLQDNYGTYKNVFHVRIIDYHIHVSFYAITTYRHQYHANQL